MNNSERTSEIARLLLDAYDDGKIDWVPGNLPNELFDHLRDSLFEVKAVEGAPEPKPPAQAIAGQPSNEEICSAASRGYRALLALPDFVVEGSLPAPKTKTFEYDDPPAACEPRMTLRQWYIGMALQGGAVHSMTRVKLYNLAERAIMLADIAIAAEKRPARG